MYDEEVLSSSDTGYIKRLVEDKLGAIDLSDTHDTMLAGNKWHVSMRNLRCATGTDSMDDPGGKLA